MKTNRILDNHMHLRRGESFLDAVKDSKNMVTLRDKSYILTYMETLKIAKEIMNRRDRQISFQGR